MMDRGLFIGGNPGDLLVNSPVSPFQYPSAHRIYSWASRYSDPIQKVPGIKVFHPGIARWTREGLDDPVMSAVGPRIADLNQGWSPALCFVSDPEVATNSVCILFVRNVFQIQRNE